MAFVRYFRSSYPKLFHAVCVVLSSEHGKQNNLVMRLAKARDFRNTKSKSKSSLHSFLIERQRKHKWVPFSIERKTIPRVINCILQWLEWSEISFYVIKNVLERFFVAFPEALPPHKLVQMTGQHGSMNTIHRFKLPFTILTHTLNVWWYNRSPDQRNAIDG